ncbi:MAG: DUF2721 domain-containing protein [Stygiobacter sp.]|jgi:hypothetical protein|uniref:DUF2721 domain-containing protein n=1 Tax=Stygiobacter electus TaxID=3032292 RepID=A0AAE3TC64_9BACT|nr:DUF2721 domain-containing protein [Stygiobacter electus]MDF1612088.1 DUF2721 domain-containing protein [Stygiobacter electus]
MNLLNNITLNALQIIQLMLAPAVMINACGLLLLGINNRYSLVVNRIRLLNEEKRKLMLKIGEKSPSIEDNIRLESLAVQINALTYRARLIRNSVLGYAIAIALFISTSLVLGISSVLSLSKLNFIIIITFLLGMISVIVGVIFAGHEALKGYEIISYEVKAHE